MSGFVLPTKREAGYLSPDIAGEGAKVLMSDGEVVSFNLPPPKPVMPDWSEIKSIRHYFNRTGFRVYPAWLYHPTEQPRVVKDEHEAAELGVCYREATVEEKGRYGLDRVWDWKDDSVWRPQPYAGTTKFNPNKAEQGKVYVITPQSQNSSNREMLESALPAVTAAVVAALKQGGSVGPENVDKAQWDKFLAFQAWEKTQQAIDAIVPASGALEEVEEKGVELSGEIAPEVEEPLTETGLPPEQERKLWEEEAVRKGLKVDKRWSLDRLRNEVEKAA
jgi:hypothetical protein